MIIQACAQSVPEKTSAPTSSRRHRLVVRKAIIKDGARCAGMLCSNDTSVTHALTRSNVTHDIKKSKATTALFLSLVYRDVLL